MDDHNRLTEDFETQRKLIYRFAEGMTHEDSLVTPTFKANNFNWVLGHILVSRDRVLRLLGREKVLTAEEAARYETGAELVDQATAVELKRLLHALDNTQDAISAGLAAASEEELSVRYRAGIEQTIRQRIEGLLWHETYHLGQLEILRQVSAERPSFP